MSEPEIKPSPYVPEPGKIAIRDADGSVWKIPAGQLGKAESEGARLATEAEYHAGRLGAAGQVASGAIGGARGVSLGYSDALYTEGARALAGDEAADKVRHALNLGKEMHPDVTAGSELAGAAVPLFFGGGGAAAVGGEGFAAGALRAAPRAFAEGAVIGAGQQSSEDTLGNHKALAENYITAGFKGGAVNVLLGAGLHAAAGGGAPRFGRPSELVETVGPEARAHAEEAALALEGASPGAGPYRTAGVREPGVEAPGSAATPSFAPTGEQLGLPLGPGSAQGELPFTPPELPTFTSKHAHLSPESLEAGLRSPEGEVSEPFLTTTQPRTDIPGASYETLLDRAQYGGRKGASAERRLADFPHENVVRSHLEEPVSIFDGSRNYHPTEPAPFEARFGVPRASEEEQLDLLGRGQGELPLGPGPRQPIGELREPPPFARAPEAPVPQAAPVAPDPVHTAAAETIAAETQPLSTMGRLQNEVDRQQFAATGARVPDIRKLGADAQTQDATLRRVGATLAKEVPTGPITSLQDYAEKIATRAKEVGKSIRPMYEELNAAAARPMIGDIERRFSAVQREIGGKLFGDEELVLAEKALAAVREKGGANPSFTKLYDLRRDLDEKLAKHFARIPGMPQPPGEAAVRALRDIVQDELMTAADRASAELGKPIADRLRTANTLYKDLKIAKDISTKEAARASGSPAYTASDMLSVVAAMASGSPLGAAIPVANIIRKKYGNQIAAHVLRKVQTIEAIQNAGAKVDELLNKGTRAVIEDSSASARPFKTLTTEEVRKVRDAASNPAAVTQRVADAMGDMPQFAPKVANEFAQLGARIASYLAQTLPKDRPPSASAIFSGKHEHTFSDSELIRASNIIEIAGDPTIAVDRMRQGLLTNEHVKALKAMHPETFFKIQDYLTRHATELRRDMSVQQQINLSILFQKPIAECMERSNVTALQASFVGGSQAPKTAAQGLAPSVAKMAAGPVKGGGTRATTFDLAEKGGR